MAALALTAGAASGCGTARDLGGVHVVEGARGRAFDPAKVAERSAGAVGVVVTNEGRGLGFVVDPHGYMITNRHVIEDADHVEMVSFPGLDSAPEYTSVDVVYIDPVRDLALLHIRSDEPLPHIELATGQRVPVSDYVAERDDVVLLERQVDPAEAAELDEDPGLLAHLGRVERLEVYNPSMGPGPYLGVTAQVERGQSGGPVLDRWGRAVGVVTWTWRGQKGGFAIPISEAARMLEERPRLDSDVNQRARAEDRVRSYLAALGTGSDEELRRLTSPSLAREVRGRTVEVLLERSTEHSILQGFLAAIDELVRDAAGERVDPFPKFERMVAHTGSREFMRELGVEGTMSEDAVETFFFAVGSSYLAARWFGELERYDALMVAYQRVHSLDVARSMVLVDTIESLAGVRAEVEDVELIPGLYAPQAVAAVDIGGGRKVAVQMRLEWGDWYVSEVQLMSKGQRERPGVGSGRMRSVGVQSNPG
ncbi:trypsin-like peptidase domain-containing protein [Pseudenhygromyxa sp. WMMC2535]|uniref:trypsin-like peptidase domain-containing protein n=1 Tax=Pseudenhygromyxa sp. WMMC2535 TaxID=2712867 RepID=UPI001557BF23|nr:trypsin-like peptidase domain-containing protein [Pseudenhygromyxa sp. WMMC2535]NVB41385.1 trypsin-like peptidase domain-containing protein [Pseudenhygromyxa sp. WMMC2535]NVB43695.1 trypsin-like peptidase domain-containing protein [Pseudenhygromyxa sp. WMMC2535]